MQFLAIVEGYEAPVLPPLAEIAAVKATLQQIKSDQRVKHVWPFADERGGAFIVEVNSAEELQDVVGALPMSRLAKWTSHPLSSVEATLKLLDKVEQNIQQMMPVGAGAR